MPDNVRADRVVGLMQGMWSLGSLVNLSVRGKLLKRFNVQKRCHFKRVAPGEIPSRAIDYEISILLQVQKNLRE